MKIRVCVAGATGLVGRSLVHAIYSSEDLELVGAVSRTYKEQNLGVVLNNPQIDLTISGSVEEALRIMTIDAAYALFMEDRVGSLKPGKYADLVILSDNPLTIDPDSIIDIEVLLTMVGGQIEYCTPEYAALCPD